MKRAVKSLFLIGLILSGCEAIRPTPASTSTPTKEITPTPQGVVLPFETIERAEVPGTGGEYQGESPRLVVIARAAEMDVLGNTISNAAQEELRKLDFNHYFVIAAFQGLKGTNMYGVDIQRVIRDGGQITIFAHFTERDPELVAADVNTSPYHIIKIQKDGLQGEFDFLLNVDGEVILKVPFTL